MKKTTKAIIATGAVAITGAVGVLTLQPENPDNLPIKEQIQYYEQILAEKEEAGEGLTITVQKIESLKAKLKNP